MVIQQLQVGAATLTVLKDGEWIDATTWGELFPGEWPPEYVADFALPVSVPCYCYHIALPTASILVDPGMGQVDLSRGGTRIERTAGVIASLATIGIKPTEITHVIITHAHPDHFIGAVLDMGNGFEPAYPNAQCFMGAADWHEHPQRQKPESRFARTFTCLQERGLLHLIDGEHELPGGVSMLPAPGESPGHSVVRVASAGQVCYILGDLVHHPLEVEYPTFISKGRDVAAMIATRQRLIPRMLEENAILLASHIRGSGELRFGPDGMARWRFQQRFDQ